MLVLTGMTCLSTCLFVDGEILSKWICFGLWAIAVVIFNSVMTFMRPIRFKVFGSMLTMLTALVATSFIVAVHGLLQYKGVLVPLGTFRIVGAFDNPAGFAMTLSMMFPFVLLGMVCVERYLRTLSFITCFVVFISVALSESRAGILSILIILIIGGHRFLTKRPVVKWAFIIAWILLLFGYMVIKSDSASGRLLIWNVTLEMIADHWFVGLGHGGFASEYMNYQAAFLSECPNEKWMMLADNVQHPFNEFLFVWVNYGVFAVGAMILLFLYAFVCYRKDKTPEKSAAFYSILSIFIFSMFSYPFKYPLTWFMVLYSGAVLVHDEGWVHKLSLLPCYLKRIFAVLSLALCLWITFYAYCRVCDEVCWADIVSSNNYGSEQMQSYKELYPSMKRNRYYLYNYAYALYSVGDYDSADKVLSECSFMWADYDVQILTGVVAMKQGRYEDAVSCFDVALQMCPNRFRPVFLKQRIAEEIGNKEDVLMYANEILHKRIKVPSREVVRIISYAKNVKGKL